MNSEHYIVLGVARPRASWFSEVGRWATSAALPVEFVKCLSVDEARARLAAGRPYSAILVDEGCSGLDRDLLDEARRAGCAPAVVRTGASGRDRGALGAAGVLSEPIDRETLHTWLRDHASPFDRTADGSAHLGGSTTTEPAWSGRTIAVVGAGGVGTSTIAMAIAQAFGSDPANGGQVALVDACLHASLALLHDNGDVVPGLQELVELHRTGRPDNEQVRSCLWSHPDRGYDLLPGLRRHRDWTALRPRAVEATMTSLRQTYAVVVADTDADLEGQSDTGSIDVEERNACSRALVSAADVVVVTATSGVVGTQRLVRLLADLISFGVDPQRLLPVVNQAPRSPRRRAEISRAVALLLGDVVPGAATVSPLMVPLRRDVEAVQLDGTPLPRAFVAPVGAAVEAVLARVADPLPHEVEPVKIEPGSLGTGAVA